MTVLNNHHFIFPHVGVAPVVRADMSGEIVSGDAVAIPTVGIGHVATVDRQRDEVSLEPVVDCEASELLDSERGEYIVPYAVAAEWAHHH